ncbi:MAG: hypothetical protein ACRBDL_08725 [Alphaproteobacteria bacterium]
MQDLKTIRKALSGYFRDNVTVAKLQDAAGSKTVRHAKAVGVYVARKEGHEYDDIAKAFGYDNPKSVSRVFAKVGKDIDFDGMLQRDVNAVAEDLGIDLE